MVHALPVFDEEPTADELLEMWRDATLAAELADRLAREAAETLAHADQRAVDAEALADLAQQLSDAADQAADRARDVAGKARQLAVESRGAEATAAKHLTESEAGVGDARGLEAVARDRFTERGEDGPSRSDRVQGQDSRSAS